MSRLFEALSKLKLENQPSDVIAPKIPQVTEVSSCVAVAPADFEVACLAEVRPAPAARLVALTDPDSLGSEKFRALVTRLDHVRKQQSLKSLQVISSVVHEGKTLVSANLGLTLAKYTGSRTLLVEGDLHRPALASLLGLTELQGMSHWWLRQDKHLTSFLYQLNDMPLWLLPAGMAHDQPSTILRSARFVDAFSQLVDRFDWVIVDSTPMLPIVDVNLWSRLVDGTLLVIREGVTPVKALKRGLESLDHPKLVGVVLNEAQESGSAMYGDQYYGAPKRRKTQAKMSREDVL